MNCHHAETDLFSQEPNVWCSISYSDAEYIKAGGENYANTCCFNVTGHPSLTINAAFSNGLPVGLMMVGKKFNEVTIFNVARAWEKIRDSE